MKNTYETAVQSFVAANAENPSNVLVFGIPLPKYYDWVHRGIMLHCPWVDGYRIQRDIDLKELGHK